MQKRHIFTFIAIATLLLFPASISSKSAHASTSTVIAADTVWTARDIASHEVVTVDPGATLTITGSVRNYGTLNVNGKVVINPNSASGAAMSIESGGKTNIHAGGSLLLSTERYSSSLFVSERGTLNLYGTMTIEENTVVNIREGTLTIDGGTLNDYGTLNVGEQLGSDGDYEYLGGTLVISSGVLRVMSGGKAYVSPIGTFSIDSDGKFYLYGTLDLPAVAGKGGTLTINSGTMHIFSGGAAQVGFFLNPGTFYGPGNGISSINLNGGNINIDSGAKMDVFGQLAVSGIIENRGTLTIQPISGRVSIAKPGTLNINSGGVLDLPTVVTGPIVASGKIDIAGWLRVLAGGTVSNSGTITKQCGGSYTIDAAGTLGGNSIVDASGCTSSEPKVTTTQGGTFQLRKVKIIGKIIPSEAGTHKFEIAVENRTFDIIATGEGIESVTFDQEHKVVTVDTMMEGLLELEIPRDLLSGNFTVVDNSGQLVSFEMSETETSSLFIIERSSEPSTLSIQGTNVIPEFPWPLMLLVLTLSFVVLLVNRKNIFGLNGTSTGASG